jgi:hypothetical protein
MAEITKFNEKNIALFGVIEATAGTYQAPATTDVLAATTLTGAVTYETGAYQYLGDSLSRDEFSYQKDSYADVTVETPQQVLRVLNTALPIASAPLSTWMQACGANITVDGGTGAVTYDNATVNSSKISIDYRKTSAQDAVTQKLTRFFGCQGTVDVTVDLGDVAKLKFGFKGNATTPVQDDILAPNLQNQTNSVCATVRQSSIVLAEIVPFGEVYTAQAALSGTVTTITRVGTTATVTMSVGHGLSTGRLVNISGATDPLYNGDFIIVVTSSTVFTYTMQSTPAANASGSLVAKAGGYKKTFCFNKLSAANFFGFDYQRYLTGCEEGFSKGGTPTDVSVTMLEDKSATFSINSITFVTTAATVTAPGHGMVNGQFVTVSGATGVDAAIYNGTYIVAGVTANTFTYTMLSTPAGVATGYLLGLNTNATIFDPDANISNFFAARVKFGSGPGRYVTYKWDKLQVSDVKEGKVANLFARDVTFRNTSKSYIILE